MGSTWPRPWGSFAGGATLVARHLIDAGVRFDERLDAGYGEDVDFGLSVRAAGSNVLYAPACPTVHLKTSVGGYRDLRELPWSKDAVEPKPSPTVLLSRKKHHTREMLAGYRLAYTLRRLRGAKPWQIPWRLREIGEQWRSSVRWTSRLST